MTEPEERKGWLVSVGPGDCGPRLADLGDGSMDSPPAVWKAASERPGRRSGDLPTGHRDCRAFPCVPGAGPRVGPVLGRSLTRVRTPESRSSLRAHDSVAPRAAVDPDVPRPNRARRVSPVGAPPSATEIRSQETPAERAERTPSARYCSQAARACAAAKITSCHVYSSSWSSAGGDARRAGLPETRRPVFLPMADILPDSLQTVKSAFPQVRGGFRPESGRSP